MALIKQANARTIARDAVVLDLGDLQRQGDSLIAQARAEARRIIADAHEQRERTVAGAAEAGHAQGYAAGLDQGRLLGLEKGREEAVTEFKSRLETLETAWTETLLTFNKGRELLVQSAERDVIRLAATIAEKVVKRTVELDPAVVIDQLRAVIGVVVRPSELLLSIHPADRQLIEQALPGLMKEFQTIRHASLVDDPSLQPGSCTARTRDNFGSQDAGASAGGASGGGNTGGGGNAGNGGGAGGEIDASIQTQLDRIVAALLPEPGRGTVSL